MSAANSNRRLAVARPWLVACALVALCACQREPDANAKGHYVELALDQQQAEQLNQQQKFADQLETAEKQQERTDRQLERYEQQMQRSEALLARNERIMQRLETLAARQEKQADRYDRLLERWEAEGRTAKERSP